MLFKVTRLCLKSVRPIVGRTAKFAGINSAVKAVKVNKNNKAKKTTSTIVSNTIPTVATEVEEKLVKTVDKIVDNTVSQNTARKQGLVTGLDLFEAYMNLSFAIITMVSLIVLCIIIVSEIMRLYRMGW